MQNGKFYEVYGDAARLLGRLLDLRVAEKPLMTGRGTLQDSTAPEAMVGKRLKSVCPKKETTASMRGWPWASMARVLAQHSTGNVAALHPRPTPSPAQYVLK